MVAIAEVFVVCVYEVSRNFREACSFVKTFASWVDTHMLIRTETVASASAALGSQFRVHVFECCQYLCKASAFAKDFDFTSVPESKSGDVVLTHGRKFVQCTGRVIHDGSVSNVVKYAVLLQLILRVEVFLVLAA